MASYFTDNEDLRFYMSEGALDWAQLVEITEYGYRTQDGFKGPREALEFYTQVAEMVGELAADEVAPRAARIDREETRLVGGEAVPGAAMTEIFERIKAADVHRLCLPRELGGLNAPILLYFLAAEMLARGDVSVMTHHSFHGGMAMAMLVYSMNEGTTELDLANASIAKTRFAAEMDEIAEIITAALRATAPAAAGAKAKYTLDDRVAASCRERCAELLSRHPLYPGIQL